MRLIRYPLSRPIRRGLSFGTKYIKSTQQFTVTIAGGSLTGTATLSPAVTAARAIILPFPPGETNFVTNNPSQCSAFLQLTNGTTITATRAISGATSTITIVGYIIDCYATLVNSVQYGTIDLTASASGSTAINPVTFASASVHYLGLASTSVSTSGTYIGTTFLPDNGDGTSISVDGGRGSTGASTVAFCAVDWNPAVIQSCIGYNPVTGGTNTTDPITVASTTMANTLLFYAGLNGFSLTTRAGYFSTLQQTTSTNVNMVRNTGTSGNRQPSFYLVEFISAVAAALFASTPQSNNIVIIGSA